MKLKQAIAEICKMNAVYLGEIKIRGKVQALANIIDDEGKPTCLLVLSDNIPYVVNGKLGAK